MSGTPNTFVGEYRLLGEVARGGQGAVFRALRSDGAQVALKLLLDLEPESLARFEREALGLARLQHPNVVRVHDYGREGRKPYLVMEWIEGETLYERVQRGGPLSPEEAVEVLGEIASALSHCHSQGIVHRDLKPQNVVLAGRGAVLVDFGLVREVGSGGGELGQRLTATGEVLGTPSYMAPEQADARFGEVSSATDVYALGATLYFMLTGYPPLELAGGLVAALVELLEGAPPDPRVRRPDIPAPLATLCLRSLGKRPPERPPDAGAFLADLHQSMTGGVSPRGWAPWATGAAALVALALVVLALVVDGRFARPLEPAPRPAATQSPELPPEARAEARAEPSKTTSVAPALGDAPATPAETRSSASLPSDTRSLIKKHLFVGNDEQAWRLIKPALEAHPHDEELLSLGVLALEAKPRARAAELLDLRCRLQAQSPTAERAIDIGQALRIHLRRSLSGLEWERALERAIAAMEAAPKARVGAQDLELRFEQGSAYVERAEAHTRAKRWRLAEEAAEIAEARLAPGAQSGTPAQQRLARAIELQFSSLFMLDRASADLHQRFEKTVAKLERMCRPGDLVPYTCLARVYSHASNIKGLARDARIDRAKSATAAYEAAYEAAPENNPTRGNLLIYGLVQRARQSWLRGRYSQALALLQGGFSIPKVNTQCKRETLKKVYRDVWAARLRWSREGDGGRGALRQVLQERPWATEREQDRVWIEELDQELRALLESSSPR